MLVALRELIQTRFYSNRPWFRARNWQDTDVVRSFQLDVISLVERTKVAHQQSRSILYCTDRAHKEVRQYLWAPVTYELQLPNAVPLFADTTTTNVPNTPIEVSSSANCPVDRQSPPPKNSLPSPPRQALVTPSSILATSVPKRPVITCQESGRVPEQQQRSKQNQFRTTKRLPEKRYHPEPASDSSKRRKDSKLCQKDIEKFERSVTVPEPSKCFVRRKVPA